MSKDNFEEILRYVKPSIEKADSQMRKAIASELRLCVTLFCLATGDSFKTLALFFRMGESTVRGIVYETCQAIWQTMAPHFLKTPTSSDNWKKDCRRFLQPVEFSTLPWCY